MVRSLLFKEEIPSAETELVADAANPFTLANVEIAPSKSGTDIPVGRTPLRNEDLAGNTCFEVIVGRQQ